MIVDVLKDIIVHIMYVVYLLLGFGITGLTFKGAITDIAREGDRLFPDADKVLNSIFHLVLCTLSLATLVVVVVEKGL